MADVKIANFLLKDGQGNIQQIRSLTENDVTKVKQAIADIAQLKQDMATINAGQATRAYKDYYSSNEHDAEMDAGVLYLVPFNAQGEFLEYDPETDQPKNPQPVATVTDLVPAYYECVYKGAGGTKTKRGRINANLDLTGVLYNNKDATVSSHFTFSQDVDMTATQNVDSLGDTKLATAKFVRDLTAKKISEAGHLTSKFYSTGKPEDTTLIANELAFYSATDLL